MLSIVFSRIPFSHLWHVNGTNVNSRFAIQSLWNLWKSKYFISLYLDRTVLSKYTTHWELNFLHVSVLVLVIKTQTSVIKVLLFGEPDFKDKTHLIKKLLTLPSASYYQQCILIVLYLQPELPHPCLLSLSSVFLLFLLICFWS